MDLEDDDVKVLDEICPAKDGDGRVEVFVGVGGNLSQSIRTSQVRDGNELIPSFLMNLAVNVQTGSHV